MTVEFITTMDKKRKSQSVEDINEKDHNKLKSRLMIT